MKYTLSLKISVYLIKHTQTGKDEIEKLSIITSNNEKYECILPSTENKKVGQSCIPTKKDIINCSVEISYGEIYALCSQYMLSDLSSCNIYFP